MLITFIDEINKMMRVDHSCSATLLKGDGSGFPAKKSMTLRMSSFHSFWLYFLKYSPISLMCSSNFSIRPSM